MGQGVGDGALEEGLGRSVERLVRGQICVEGMQRAEEPLLLDDPGMGLGRAPAFVSLDGAQGPFKQVAHVGEDLDRHAPGPFEFGEIRRSVLESPGRAIGKRSDGVAEQFAFFVHGGNIQHGECGR